MRKILFYLPVITPWWFDTIVARLIKTLAVEAQGCRDVHDIADLETTAQWITENEIPRPSFGGPVNHPANIAA